METPPGWTLRKTLKGHEGKIGRLVWSPDARYIATPGSDGLIIVWDATTGKPEQVIRGSGPVSSAAFSPDSKKVAYGLSDPDGPDVTPGYPEPEDLIEDDPLPPELDELLGDFERSNEWEAPSESSSGTRIPIRIDDLESGESVAAFSSSRSETAPRDIRWPGDGREIISASDAGTATWQTRTGQLLRLDEEFEVISVDSWGQTVVSVGSYFWEVRNAHSGELIQEGAVPEGIYGWEGEVELSFTDVAASSKGIALGLTDGSIQIVRPDGESRILEGHTQFITSLAFSHDERLLASKSLDGTVRLWDCERWQALSVLQEPARGQRVDAGVAFSPSNHALATLGPAGRIARIWDLDISAIMASKDVVPTVHYSNAKVVVLGDSGVGKTGLGLVLAGEMFRPTESSHRRNVWMLRSEESFGDPPERRETYLWDLAGQPGYRLLHQLHLPDASVAVVVMDPKSEVDPLSGVRHWVRALRQAEQNGRSRVNRILVAARVDRPGSILSQERIEEAIQEFGFSGYFETSAKEGRGVDELLAKVNSAIDWEKLPKVSSTGLFDSIKSFLVAESEGGRLLVTRDDLKNSYSAIQNEHLETEVGAEFDTCIDRVAARGLIRRLSFGGLVLLQPEVLDAYAAALAMAARDQPDGMGSISEESARMGKFPIPEDGRIKDPDLERLLLTATVEEVLRHEVALRESSDDGSYLVFPTQSRREAPKEDRAKELWLSVRFEGSVANMYATLVVRLAHSGLFKLDASFRNEAWFYTNKNNKLGFSVQEVKEGEGVLQLFLANSVDSIVSGWFTDYVLSHVERRAVSDSVRVVDTIWCNGCDVEMSEDIVDGARARGRVEITCPVCDSQVDIGERFRADENELVVREMDEAADRERTFGAAKAALIGKMEVGEFDVFLAHNSQDEKTVLRIAENLREMGINPWVDKEQIPPGRWFQDQIQSAMGSVGSAAIVVGKSGLGPWEEVELKAFISECIDAELPVIPVLLPGASVPKALKFLRQLTWVEFGDSVDEQTPLERLYWGITGERPASLAPVDPR